MPPRTKTLVPLRGREETLEDQQGPDLVRISLHPTRTTASSPKTNVASRLQHGKYWHASLRDSEIITSLQNRQGETSPGNIPCAVKEETDSIAKLRVCEFRQASETEATHNNETTTETAKEHFAEHCSLAKAHIILRQDIARCKWRHLMTDHHDRNTDSSCPFP